MPTATVPLKSFSSFKSLSFDIYGTLIDWESKVGEDLEGLIKDIDTGSSLEAAKTDVASPSELTHMLFKHATALQVGSPSMRYDLLMTESYLKLAAELIVPITDAVQSDAEKFGKSVGDWPPFQDTVDAMGRLGKHFKLIALSNVDNASIERTRTGPLQGLQFWRIYTAEDIGSYKPSLRNFDYLLQHINEADMSEGGSGIGKHEDLHVAQSLFHDHEPAKKMGMSSVWINREGVDTHDAVAKKMHDEASLGYGWRFETLGAFADEVDRQFAA
jgi:2-haloalkanoic acid dehalogenase type II